MSPPARLSDPTFQAFVGYRHKFNDDLSAVVTLQDAFHTLRYRNELDSPLLRDEIHGRPQVQTLFVGLTWNFASGAKRPRDQSFDFSQPPTP